MKCCGLSATVLRGEYGKIITEHMNFLLNTHLKFLWTFISGIYHQNRNIKQTVQNAYYAVHREMHFFLYEYIFRWPLLWAESAPPPPQLATFMHVCMYRILSVREQRGIYINWMRCFFHIWLTCKWVDYCFFLDVKHPYFAGSGFFIDIKGTAGL